MTTITTLMTASMILTGMSVMAEEPVPAEAETAAVQEETATVPTLKFGDWNDDVKAVQESLISLGFLKDVADGSFGNNTREAVKEFRNVFGLEAGEEMDAEAQELLSRVMDAVHTGEDAPIEDEDFLGITVHHYEDEKLGVDVNTVSETQMKEVEALVSAVTSARKTQEETPAQDTIWVLAVDKEAEDAVFTEDISLNDLVKKAVENGAEVTLTDANGNEVFVNADGSILSNTGNLFVSKVDMDTNEVVAKAADVSVDELSWEKPNETWFRTVKIMKDEEGNIVLPLNSLSNKTVEEVFRRYVVIKTAFLNSTELPAEESPADGTATEGTPAQAATPAPTQGTAQTPVAAQPQVTPAPSVSTYVPAPEPVVTPTYQAPQFEQPVAEPQPTPVQPTTQPAPVAVSEPVTQPAAPQHEHTWTPTYTTVHHDAVTHQEPVNQVVHHDAVTHEEPIYEEVPITQLVNYTQCTGCGSTISQYASQAELDAWAEQHVWTEGNSTSNFTIEEIVGYETKQTGTQTVVDTPAWDETVTTYTTVVDSEAWDEQVISGYVCSGCGATQ